MHYVECQSDEPSGEDAWDKFSREIAEYIRGIWPERFGGDHEYEMGSLKGTTIHLIESYYDKIGLPKLINRGSPNSIPVVPQLVLGKEIYGRIWCVSPTEPSMGFTVLAFVLCQATLETLTEYQNRAKTRLLERIGEGVRRTKTLIDDMKVL